MGRDGASSGRGRVVFQIVVEPRGDVYRTLLAVAQRERSTFALVWRQQLTFGPAAYELEERLRPALLREEKTAEWPGTRLLDSNARVSHYLLDRESRGVLQEAERLFSWLAPERPEDLAFYIDGDCWLASVAHEQEAWIHPELLTPEAFQELQASVAGRIRGRGMH